MGKYRKLLLFLTTLVAGYHACIASCVDTDTVQSRPITAVYSLETGRTHVTATYLTPLKYSGSDYTVSGKWSKAMPFAPEKVLMHFDAGIGWTSALNPAGNSKMIGLDIDFRWGMDWRKRLPCGLQITAGGGAGVSGGALYLIRNGNNPVEALADVSLALHASVSKPVKLGKLNLLLQDECWMPSLGIFFSPEYGETYYEIYLGNRKGLVHAGWWGNNFRIDNHLSSTIDFGKTSLSLGYRFSVYSQWACNLNTRIFTHAFTIGVVPGGLGLAKKPKRVVSQTFYSTW